MPKAREVHDMTDAALAEHVRNARQEIFGLRFRHATGELENTASLRAAKRDLARALTIARERGLGAQQATDDRPQATDDTPETTDDS